MAAISARSLVKDFTTYGPVPIGPSLAKLRPSFSDCTSTIRNIGSAKRPGILGYSLSVLIINCWPFASIESYLKNVFAILDFSKERSIEAFTAAASTFLPLENFTLSLIVKVQVFLSGDTSHLDAIQG